jgi:hypothetical protein
LKSLEKLITDVNEKSDEAEIDRKRIQEFMQAKLGTLKNGCETNGHSNGHEPSTAEESLSENSAKLTEINSLACLTQSIAAYLITSHSRKNGDHLRNLTIKLYDSVNLWLSHLFRFVVATRR